MSGDPIVRRLVTAAGTDESAAVDAVEALVKEGGWDALAPADRALLDQFVAARHRVEDPTPVRADGWYAVSTGDPRAVAAEFGAGAWCPVPLRLGAAAWYRDPDFRLFVSPMVDGWTLVFGDPAPGSPLAARPSWPGYVEALSARFGAARWYYRFEGFSRWILAERGTVVRDYNNENPDACVGDPHPAERGHPLPHETLHPDARIDRIDQVRRTLRDQLFPAPERQPPALAEAARDWYAYLLRTAGLAERPLPDDALTDPGRFDELAAEAYRPLFAELGRDLVSLEPCSVHTVAGRASVDPYAFGPATAVHGAGLIAFPRGAG